MEIDSDTLTSSLPQKKKKNHVWFTLQCFRYAFYVGEFYHNSVAAVVLLKFIFFHFTFQNFQYRRDKDVCKENTVHKTHKARKYTSNTRFFVQAQMHFRDLSNAQITQTDEMTESEQMQSNMRRKMLREKLYDGVRICVCVCVHVPAICKEELEVSHVDLPQRHTVALRQRQSDSVHAVIQCPKHTQTKRRKIMTRFQRNEAERAATATHVQMWYEEMQTK